MKQASNNEKYLTMLESANQTKGIVTDFLYDLPDNTRFQVLGGLQGLFLGANGLYAKVHWDGKEYTERNPWDFLSAIIKVEELYEQGEEYEEEVN